jgi:glycosyltransferase involved in cell wall biosynthesis
VIVPTFNRAAVLPYLFDALGRQIYPAERMEVIVVDNSSVDDTEAVVRDWQRGLPFAVRFRRKANDGPAASRNVGASMARGELLAFTDSDCIPHPDWVRNAVRAFEADTGLVCGPITIAQAAPSAGAFDAYLDETRSESGLYPTANFVIRRDLFEAAGGFDERFGLFPWGGLKGGEDTDLAWRIRRNGHRIRFVEDVAVRHQRTASTPLASLLRPVRVQILPRLIRSIPELRRTLLYKRFFVSRLHLEFHLAWMGAGLAIATRRGLPLIAAVPWLLGVRPLVAAEARRGGPARALASSLLIIEGFAMHTLVLIAASIRHRRVVL